jgi:DNA-binding response OmpR family regulator
MKRILILEDDTVLASTIEHQLSMRGFKTYVVADVEGGIDVLSQTPVDAIWLDHYLLGKEDGIDFIVKARALKNSASVPIFVVSNSTSSASMKSYIQLGVDQYYTKTDYDLSQIITDIEHVLKS